MSGDGCSRVWCWKHGGGPLVGGGTACRRVARFRRMCRAGPWRLGSSGRPGRSPSLRAGGGAMRHEHRDLARAWTGGSGTGTIGRSAVPGATSARVGLPVPPPVLRAECRCLWHGPAHPLGAAPSVTAAPVKAGWEQCQRSLGAVLIHFLWSCVLVPVLLRGVLRRCTAEHRQGVHREPEAPILTVTPKTQRSPGPRLRAEDRIPARPEGPHPLRRTRDGGSRRSDRKDQQPRSLWPRAERSRLPHHRHRR